MEALILKKEKANTLEHQLRTRKNMNFGKFIDILDLNVPNIRKL